MRHDKFRRTPEAGFTLVELMVTVLIIGILISIALPTFLGARQRAQNRAAQSNLRNGLAAAKTYYATAGRYTGFTAAVGTGIEPSLTWAAAVGSGHVVGRVYIGAPAVSVTQIRLIALSASGRFFCIKDVAAGTTPVPRTYYGSGAGYANVNAATGVNSCQATQW